ncbi:MAG: hypothetical protein ACYC7F_05235 [Gemmatimonadaceae bacterium]
MFATIAVAYVSAACSGADATRPLTLSALCAQKDVVLAEVPFRTIDDGFEELARLLPGGFGGTTSDSMFLKNVTQADTARATARALTTCTGDAVPYLSVVIGAAVRRGDYDWVELRRWYRLMSGQNLVGLVSSDMDERVNRLAYTFLTQEALVAFQVRASSLGVPLGALALSVGSPPVPLKATR